MNKGQIVAIIGPSGSGKSTLLRSINHLEQLNKGEVWVDGVLVNKPLSGRAFEHHINKVRQRMGMVFQQFNLFPHMTVIENITAGPIRLRKIPAAQARDLAMELLRKVGLQDKFDAYPSSSPAARSSARPLPGRWRWSRP